MKRIAFRHLALVGDREHEWVEFTGYAFHLRRRLTAAEQESVGEAVDYRDTAEAVRRFEAIKGELHPRVLNLALDEIGGN